MDSWPNCRNKATFSNSSGIVWTLPHESFFDKKIIVSPFQSATFIALSLEGEKAKLGILC